MADPIELEPKPFVVRHVEDGKVWNVSVPLATIEECQSFIAFGNRNREANAAASVAYGHPARPERGKDIICRIIYEPVE